MFIRQYLPALGQVPARYLAEPHTMPPMLQQMVGCRIGIDYPAPIVDHRQATTAARERIYAVRNLPETREQARQVVIKHGSRNRQNPSPSNKSVQ